PASDGQRNRLSVQSRQSELDVRGVTAASVLHLSGCKGNGYRTGRRTTALLQPISYHGRHARCGPRVVALLRTGALDGKRSAVVVLRGYSQRLQRTRLGQRHRTGNHRAQRYYQWEVAV